MFTKAIVKQPCENLINGLTTSWLGQVDYKKALEQHHAYIKALQLCGLDVHILEPDENYPDSVFVEDTVLLTQKCAIINNPGAESRKGEIIEIEKIVSGYYTSIEKIQAPGNIEAGDIMMVKDHFYIGLSERTNRNGALQMISLLEKFGYSGSTIELNDILHLKTGVSYLENNNLLVSGEFIDHPEFRKFNRLKAEQDEAYAANSLWVNDQVLVPAGNPKTIKIIENAGYNTIILDMSEFKKLDGGLSCLSLRF